MTGAISTFQSGAQIALKLLTSGLSGRVQAPAGVVSPAPVTPAAFDRAIQGDGTRILLRAQTAMDDFGRGSDVAKAASLGDQIEVTTSGLDVPVDKAAFRRQVLDLLQSDAAGYDARYPDQAEFLKALKAGKVIVQTVDETSELNWQPNIGWSVYWDGYSQGGGMTTGGAGNQALYDRRVRPGGKRSVRSRGTCSMPVLRHRSRALCSGRLSSLSTLWRCPSERGHALG